MNGIHVFVFKVTLYQNCLCFTACEALSCQGYIHPFRIVFFSVHFLFYICFAFSFLFAGLRLIIEMILFKLNLLKVVSRSQSKLMEG